MKLKFLHLLIATMFSTIFSSCNKDEGVAMNTNIVGRWKVEVKERINCSDTSQNQSLKDDTIWEFRDDNTFTIYDNDGTTPLNNSTYDGRTADQVFLCYNGVCDFPHSTVFSSGKFTMTEKFYTQCMLRYTLVKI